ncbi:MAG: hypothetical protein ABSH22_17475, partial [Tepidisphaeraceae bacterium]
MKILPVKPPLLALLAALLFPLPARAVAPIRQGIIVLDACQFLGEMPGGDTAQNGPQGGRAFRGLNAGPAAAPAGKPPALVTFEDFSI